MKSDFFVFLFIIISTFMCLVEPHTTNRKGSTKSNSVSGGSTGYSKKSANVVKATTNSTTPLIKKTTSLPKSTFNTTSTNANIQAAKTSKKSVTTSKTKSMTKPTETKTTTTKNNTTSKSSTKNKTPGNSSSDETYRKQFVSFKKSHRKSYNNSNQEKKAQDNYIKEAKNIDAHNKRTDKTYTRKVTKTSDMTYKERVKTQMGLNKSKNRNSEKYSRGKREIIDDMPFDRFKRAIYDDANSTIPVEIDYRSRFGPIRDQGQCGACWAFSVMAVLEAFFYENVGVNITLSIQELLDCNTVDMSCENGGWPGEALDYINFTGLASEMNYQYLAYMNQCSNMRIKRAIKITDYCALSCNGNEEYLQHLVANYGPQAIVYYATEEFLSYSSGVFSTSNCPSGAINHAVVIVGYGTDPNFGDYWWIRNSWGPDWGMNGYAKIARNANSQCEVADYAFSPCGSEAVYYT